jgi:hypothetical protein
MTAVQLAQIKAHKLGRAYAGKINIDAARAFADETFLWADERDAFLAGWRGERIRQRTWEAGR